jgi:hypothetical protein
VAAKLLREDGKAAAGPMLERLAETLRAAASDDAARKALERGVVTEEYQRSGFGGLVGLIPEGANRPGAPATAARQPRDELAERRRLRAEQEQRLRELRAKARDAEREAVAAEKEADRAERAAEEARSRADDLRDEADRLAEELEEAEEAGRKR